MTLFGKSKPLLDWKIRISDSDLGRQLQLDFRIHNHRKSLHSISRVDFSKKMKILYNYIFLFNQLDFYFSK